MNLDKHDYSVIFNLWDENAQNAISSGEECQYELEEDKVSNFSTE